MWWLLRRRGRNLRVFASFGFFLLVTFLVLEHDTLSTISGDQPLFISIQSGHHDTMEYQRTCNPERNIVYIKMLKSASTTLSNMFKRFGLHRNLSFVVPIEKRIYLGWPYPLQNTFYRKPKSDSFNIMCDHAIYNSEKFREVMPVDTVYITSIREPFEQFKSTFYYYNLGGITNMNKNQSYLDYLADIEAYEEFYKSPKARLGYCVPDGMSVTKNIMAFILGFPTGFNEADESDNPVFIAQWLANLDKELQTVLIVEHYFESIVLMRRELCWEFEDVLTIKHNVGDYKNRTRNSKLLKKHQEWSKVDYVLYNHFNNTLWRKIANQKSDFWAEVSHLKFVSGEVERYCDSFPPEGAVQTVPRRKMPKIALEIKASPWHPRFVIDETKCREMKADLMVEVKRRYEQQLPHIDTPKPDVDFC
jgi:hypothetical protein